MSVLYGRRSLWPDDRTRTGWEGPQGAAGTERSEPLHSRIIPELPL